MGEWNPQVEREQAWNDLTLVERVDILLDERHRCHSLEQKQQALQAESDKLHAELVAVRAELAKVTEERDRLRAERAEKEQPLCMTCHGCGRALASCGENDVSCKNVECTRYCTCSSHGPDSPHDGPCRSDFRHPVRHNGGYIGSPAIHG